MISTGQKLYSQLKEKDFECQLMRDNGFHWSFENAKRLEILWTTREQTALGHLQKAVYSLGPSKYFGHKRISAWELDRAEYTKKEKFKHLGVFNPGSTDDLRYFFFHWKYGFKLAPVRWTDEGAPSTDEHAITSYLKSDNFSVVEFCKKLLEYREASKMLGTYIIGCAPLEDNVKVHGIWRSSGTVSGRLSCVEVPLQTAPSQLRCLFTAEEGTELCETDWSQLEIRTLAIQANARVMRETFDRGGDIYLETARKMFSLPDLQRKTEQGERLRQLTKVIALSSHYMASDESVWRTIIRIMLQDENEEIVKKYSSLRVKDVLKLKLAYFKVHWEIPIWWQKIIDEARRLGYYLESISGRLIHFYGEPDGSFLANFKNQSLGAHLMDESFLAIANEFRARGFGEHIKTQIHDSICSQGPYGSQLKYVQEKHMVKELVFDKRSIWLPCESKIGHNYAEVK